MRSDFSLKNVVSPARLQVLTLEFPGNQRDDKSEHNRSALQHRVQHRPFIPVFVFISLAGY